MQDPVGIGKNFLAMMDMAISKGCYVLSDDAILDWFGLTIYGRDAIKQFLLVHVEKTRHSVRKVANISEVSHEVLNRNQGDVDLHLHTTKKVEAECGQGDVAAKVTPDCPIRMNYQELAKAPGRSKMRPCKITRRLRFVEIKARVQTEQLSFNGTMRKSGLPVNRIVLGIDDEGDVSFMLYEGNDQSLRPRKLVFD